MLMPSCSSRLAEFVTCLSFEDIPVPVVEKAKATVLDTIGCALAGFGSQATKAALRVIEQIGGRGEASIIGINEKTSTVNAAFVNGIMSKCYDFDGPQIGGHNSPIVIPLTFALAEQQNLSGKKVIEGVVAGIEVMGRVSKALGPEHQVPHGFHKTSTSGIFGATASAGKMLKLNQEQMMDALGIAGSCVGGTDAYMQPGGAWTNSLHCGKPASDGILCAMLAQEGFTGPKWILEGIDGVLQCYSPRETTDPAALVDGLGEKWYFGENLVGYKRFACCGSMHPCLEAFNKLLLENGIDPDTIGEVTVWSGFSNYKFNCTPLESKVAPASIVEGIFSMPFCLGMLAYRREITPAQWVEEAILKDGKILSLAKKVNCLVLYDVEPEKVRIDIRTLDGRLYSVSGAFRQPFALPEFEAKFLKNNSVTNILTDDKAKEVLTIVKKLDRLSDLNDLIDLLSKRK